MSFKIFDDENTKNYTIINKSHKEKTDLLESTNLAPEIFKKKKNNNHKASETNILELTKNNRPKKYKKKNQLKNFQLSYTKQKYYHTFFTNCDDV